MVRSVPQADGSVLLHVEGEMNIYNASALKTELLAALSTEGGAGGAVLLDLSEVAEMDTSGFQLLLLMKREAHSAGRAFKVSAHSDATRTVAELFHMSAYFA